MKKKKKNLKTDEKKKKKNLIVSPQEIKEKKKDLFRKNKDVNLNKIERNFNKLCEIDLTME